MEEVKKEKIGIYIKPNCKKCYGRGYIGFNKTLGKPQLCTCLRRVKYDATVTTPIEDVEKT